MSGFTFSTIATISCTTFAVALILKIPCCFSPSFSICLQILMAICSCPFYEWASLAKTLSARSVLVTDLAVFSDWRSGTPKCIFLLLLLCDVSSNGSHLNTIVSVPWAAVCNAFCQWVEKVNGNGPSPETISTLSFLSSQSAVTTSHKQRTWRGWHAGLALNAAINDEQTYEALELHVCLFLQLVRECDFKLIFKRSHMTQNLTNRNHDSPLTALKMRNKETSTTFCSELIMSK